MAIINSFLDVKSYGATGNGSTDDTTAIQTALNYASLNNGVVYLPAGTYKITSTLNIPLGVSVRGAGGAWNALNGTWGINSNEAYSVTDASVNFAVLPTVGTGDYILSCAIKGTLASASVNRLPTLSFRHIDVNNHLCVYMANGSIYLSKNDVGVWTDYASASTTTADNVYYNVRIKCEGSNIKVYVDNVFKINYNMNGTDFTKFGTSGITGMRLTKSGSPATAARWNNFIIEPL